MPPGVALQARRANPLMPDAMTPSALATMHGAHARRLKPKETAMPFTRRHWIQTALATGAAAALPARASRSMR